MTMMFKPAVKKQSRMRLAVSGPSGSGKTWAALVLAKGFGGKIALIDTERGSASLYAGKPEMPEFETLELNPPYTPERFIECIKAAEQGGFDVLIIDSLTHEWNGSGGCLELVDEVAAAKYRGNSWSAWNEITPRHRAMIDTILQSPLHIICTMRSKTETSQVDEGGRKKVVKLGMKAEQRDGSEYEFTIVLDLVHDRHYATASKDRTGVFSGDPRILTEADGKRLRSWLDDGAPDLKDEALRLRKAAREAKTVEDVLNVSKAEMLPKIKEASPAAYEAIMTEVVKREQELNPQTKE